MTAGRAGGGVPSKSAATWIAVAFGSLGLHHLYLGRRRWLAALYPPPAALGLAGVLRMRALGQDDRLAWLMIPWLGLAITAGMLCAIVIGLTSDAAWARRHHPAAAAADPEDERPAGTVPTGWGPVLGVILALMLGGGVLVGTIAFSVQKAFEWPRGGP